MDSSPLQNARYVYKPKLPAILRGPADRIGVVAGAPAEPATDRERLRSIFPLTYGKTRVDFASGANPSLGKKLTVGVILSGGPAPGGHNVIAGLFDGLKAGNRESRLYGFRGGPGGLVEDKFMEIDAALVDRYRNTGGFDLIGSGRTKIETPEQFAKALETAKRRKLDAVVVIGGDDSNTNAALLAEYFAEAGRKDPGTAPIAVVGVPKTIDGDLKNDAIETSFGFDTATKIYSELIGNIERDAASSRKYWHFIKLMGRSASHIALECAFQCRPNVTLISEEVEARSMSLRQIVDQIARSVVVRAEKGENFGVVLIPEGLIEFVPEVKLLIEEINDILATGEHEFKALSSFVDHKAFVLERLTEPSAQVYESLPRGIQEQLLWDRDPHGNVQVSRIETEKLLVEMVKARLADLASADAYRGKFDYQTHFFGYEGRCGFPSNFDADYCYSLGYTAFVLAASGLSGYLASVRNLAEGADKWAAGGVPLISMMNMERRHGADKPVIRKALVELEGVPFKKFAAQREEWAQSSDYRFPGPVQYFGPSEVVDTPTTTLVLEHAARAGKADGR
ncbi:MAG TPA: diphosphate--fructose-6-phosphate 1-phosphotransferase [Rectinemataceae bacterium]|nr:diphosphate--fructose-6-phosphate 1-phosphotransferase [Rectinemataceae bacterium]